MRVPPSGLCLLLVSAMLPRVAESSEQSLKREQLVVQKPASGVAAVGKWKPTFCDHVVSEGYTPTSLGRMIETEITRDQAIKAMCVDPEDPVFQEQVGYYLQGWVNYTGQTPAQIDAYFAARAREDQWQKEHETTCVKVAIGEEASEREKTLGGMRKSVLGCGYEAQIDTPYHFTGTAPSSIEHMLWHYDRDAEPPTQLAAIFRVLECARSADPADADTVAHFAPCVLDARLLDEKKLEAELAADSHNEYARLTAAQALATAKRRATLLEKALTARVAKDADMKEVLVDAPARAWKEWVAAAAADKALLDGARAYEDKFNGPRKSAAKGCLGATHAALDKYMSAHAAKDVASVLAAATSHVGAALVEAARSCNEAEGRADVVRAMTEVIQAGFPRRGPRFAAYVAMGEALSKILADRPKFPLEGSNVSADLTAPVEVGQKNAQMMWQYAGTVSKVDKKGERVFVTFKTDSWTEDERECTPTNRIAMFRPDGSPIYESNCRMTGKKIKRTSTSDPFWVWSPLATGIAKGAFIRYRTGVSRENNVFEGIPVEVWADKTAKSLRATMGLPAK